MTRRTLLAITELFVIVMMTSRGIAQTPTLSVCVSNLKRSLSLTMYFGNDNRATYGIDKSLGEIEGPPFGPSLDVRWLSRRKDISYGFGLLRNDFVPCPTNEERKDTFILLISQPDKKPTTWILEWKRDELRTWADSMFLVVRSDKIGRASCRERV